MKLEAKRLEEKSGRLYVTVEFGRPRWQQFLGASKTLERTFGLCDYGREVFDACDGKTSAVAIARRFARNHRISIAEAEVSVSTFLKTLLARGMVGIEIERTEPGARGARML